MIANRIGFALISFNRVQYLEQTLRSLEAQTHLDGVDFHLWQDGYVNRFSGKLYAEPQEIAACVDEFKRARLPNKHFHIRTANVGTAINQFVALEYMVNVTVVSLPFHNGTPGMRSALCGTWQPSQPTRSEWAVCARAAPVANRPERITTRDVRSNHAFRRICPSLSRTSRSLSNID